MAGSTKNGTDVVLAPLGMLIGQVDYASGEQAFDTSGSTETTLLPSLVVADRAGEGLAFTAAVTNTGSADLTNVVVTGLSGTQLGTIADLAPGSSQSFTGQLQVKQSDIDAGGTLVIGAKAIDNQGDQVLASKGIPVLQLPGLSISETFDTAPYDPRNRGQVDHVYQVINYAVSVTNTGNETLTGLQTTDGQKLDHLDVGKTWTYTSSYQVTQDEMDTADKGITNTVSVGDDQGDQKSTSVTTPVVQDPEASILLMSADQTSIDHAGEVINFTVIEANTGNVTLDVTATDKLNGVWTTLGTDTLMPSQAKFLNFSYTVTQADIDAGLSIGALVEAKSPLAAFGNNSWKQVGVSVDQKPTVNVENLESFDGGQTWYFHQMPGFATVANLQAALQNAGGTGTVVGYTAAPNITAGTQVLQAALVTNTGNVTEHQLSVQGFAFDGSDLAPGNSMLSHTVSTTASSTSGTYTNSVSASGNHTVSYGWNIQVPFGLTSNTDTASYSVGDVVGTNTISVALNASTQPSFVASASPAAPTSDPWAAVDAMLAQIQSDMQSAAAQVQAATDYVNSLPPLPNFGQQTTTAPSGSVGLSDLQAALSQLQSMGILHS
jgi:hypothetical protein